MEEKQLKIFFVIETIKKDGRFLFPGRKRGIIIDIYACIEESRLIVTLKLSKKDWKNLLIFLKNTNNKNLIPKNRVAFSGFNLTTNKVFYISGPNIEMSEKIIKERLKKNEKLKNDEEYMRSTNKSIAQEKEEKKRYEEGEILGRYISLIKEDVEVRLGREDFKKFKNGCFVFEANKMNKNIIY